MGGLHLDLHKNLQWESSEVDWCEGNFEITRSVAEFFNTISNVLFFIIPPVLIVLSRQYASRVTYGIHLVWILLIMVGAGSAYFHATLSLVGQLLDELLILWVITAACALWFPYDYMPVWLKHDKSRFRRAVIFSAAVCSALSCVMPVINMFGLFTLAVPITTVLVIKVRRTHSDKAYWLGVRCLVTWTISIMSWILDKFACNIFQSIHFPYLHCVWHLGVFLASYTACTLFAYFDAKEGVPEQMPTLRYWPTWAGNMGIPFIMFKVAGNKPCKDFSL